MNKLEKREPVIAAASPVCESPEYLQCAMQAADEGVKPLDIKRYCGCTAS